MPKVSSPAGLSYEGHTELRPQASGGRQGHLLIDPMNVSSPLCCSVPSIGQVSCLSFGRPGCSIDAFVPSQIHIESDDGYDESSSDNVNGLIDDNLIESTDELIVTDGTLSVSAVLTALESGDLSITAFQFLYLKENAELVSAHVNSHTLMLDGRMSLTIESNSKINLQGPVVLQSSNGGVTVNGDIYGESGLQLNPFSTLTVGTDGAVSSSATQAIEINAQTIDLTGTINTPGYLFINPTGTGLNNNEFHMLGDVEPSDDAAFHLTNSEMQRITATMGMKMTDGVSGGGIQVTGVDVKTVSIVTLLAQQNGGRIEFENDADDSAFVGSTFQTLFVQADNGITVDDSIYTDVGDMHLDGDYDDAPDTSYNKDVIKMYTGWTLHAAGTLKMESTSGNPPIKCWNQDALTLKGNQGILMLSSFEKQSLSNPPQPLILYADADSDGEGTLTINAGVTVEQTRLGMVEITAADIDLQGSLQSVDGGLLIHPSPANRSIGVGDDASTHQVHISSTELQAMTASEGLVVGGGTDSGNVSVAGITKEVSANILHVITIQATEASSRVVFDTAPSTFAGLAVEAAGGVKMDVSVYAPEYLDGDGSTVLNEDGYILLNGDTDDSATGDAIQEAVDLAANLTLRSAYTMTLQASSGQVTGRGALTLTAGTGIVIETNLDLPAEAAALVLSTDDTYLTVASSKTVTTTNGPIMVTASDLDLSGGINIGTSTVTLHTNERNIGLSDSEEGNQFSLTNTEFSQITAAQGLVLGSSTAGTISVTGMTAASSENVGGIITLYAGASGKSVDFTTTASTFGSLHAQADAGITMPTDVTTVVGPMLLDGDCHDGGTMPLELGDTSVAVSITAATDLTMRSGASYIERRGELSLTASSGISINTAFQQLSTIEGDAPLYVDADSDNDGAGTFTLTQTMGNENNELHLTAADIQLQNTLNLCGTISCTGTLKLYSPSTTHGIGLGTTDSDSFATDGAITLDHTELQRISAAGLYVGGIASSGDMRVVGLGDPNIADFKGIITLVAAAAESSITFAETPSVFRVLVAQADDAIDVQVDVSTATYDGIAGGSIILGDGNGNDSGANDAIKIAADVSLMALTTLTLQAKAAGIVPLGNAQLTAGEGITLEEDVNPSASGYTLTLISDSDTDDTGTLTIVTDKTVASNSGPMIITAADVDLQGRIDCGTESLTVHGSTSELRTRLGDYTGADGLALSDAELGRITVGDCGEMACSGTTTIGSSTLGDIYIRGLTAANTANLGLTKLIATASDKRVYFVSSDSTFGKNLEIDASLVYMDASVTTSGGDVKLDVGSGSITIRPGLSQCPHLGFTHNMHSLRVCDLSPPTHPSSDAILTSAVIHRSHFVYQQPGPLHHCRPPGRPSHSRGRSGHGNQQHTLSDAWHDWCHDRDQLRCPDDGVRGGWERGRHLSDHRGRAAGWRGRNILDHHCGRCHQHRGITGDPARHS